MVHAHVGGDCCPLGDSAHGRGVPGRRRELLLLRWCGTEPPAAARHDEGVRARQQGGREQTHIHGILLLFRGEGSSSRRRAISPFRSCPASLESKPREEAKHRKASLAGTSEAAQAGGHPSSAASSSVGADGQRAAAARTAAVATALASGARPPATHAGDAAGRCTLSVSTHTLVISITLIIALSSPGPHQLLKARATNVFVSWLHAKSLIGVPSFGHARAGSSTGCTRATSSCPSR
jgi:hypothetical protein